MDNCEIFILVPMVWPVLTTTETLLKPCLQCWVGGATTKFATEYSEWYTVLQPAAQQSIAGAQVLKPPAGKHSAAAEACSLPCGGLC